MSIGIFSNSGNDVRLLKDQLDLNGTAKVLTGTDDPRSVAKNAPQGSIYLQTGATGGKVFKKRDDGSSTNWSEVGSGAGGINYILNPDAEAGTTGWATYADTAAATPVDGTGGSPTVTFTTSSSSPLRGNNSFLITKDAANRQGEGASYAFSIDTADRASVMAIEFDYAVASGTFAAGDSSDIRVFVYDVTNSQLITPVATTIQSNTQSKFKGLFQTNSNSSSYRLILHVATTSASAYTFKIDNVRVGPQAVTYGAAVTDWQTFTPAWTASTTDPTIGNGTITGAWRRVGDSVEILGYILWGSTTTNGSGAHYFGFPSGVVMDTSKLVGATAQNNTLGWATYHNSGAAVLPMSVVWDTTTRVSFNVWQNSSAIAVQGQLSDASGGSTNDELFWSIKFPVVGWSSGVQISNDAETRIVAARYTSNAGQSIPSATVTIVDFEDRDFDTHGLVTTGASWKFTAGITGYYRVTARVGWSTMSTTNNYNAYIYKNNALYSRVAASGDNPIILIADTVSMVPGDFIDIRTDQDTGGSVSLSSTSTDLSVDVSRIAGPTAIAANELVAAQYKRTTAQSLPNAADTIFQPDTKDFDTHSAVTTGASWRFTAPVAGRYQVTYSMGFAANATGIRYAFVRKNGTGFGGATSAVPVTGADTFISGSCIVTMVPGDYVDLNVYQSSGGSLNTALASGLADAMITIQKVGF